VNLWQNNHTVYGNPDIPIEEVLHPMRAWVDANAVGAKVRVITTGHGQGNTDNCAEFCPKEHTVVVNGTPHVFTPWRDDCAQNPCSPQGGTWRFNRAGWCPGDKVVPWDLDITGEIVPGDSVKLNYNVEEYENFCRPSNPDCVEGPLCPDCDYNNVGHTQPHYTIQSQLILYRERPVGVGDDDRPPELPRSLVLGQNYPNPFNPSTTISFDLPEGSATDRHVVVEVYSVRGKRVSQLVDALLEAGQHRVAWNGTDDRGEPLPSGVYIYTLRVGDRSLSRKMLLVK
jgi:hypothetical protein